MSVSDQGVLSTAVKWAKAAVDLGNWDYARSMAAQLHTVINFAVPASRHDCQVLNFEFDRWQCSQSLQEPPVTHTGRSAGGKREDPILKRLAGSQKLSMPLMSACQVIGPTMPSTTTSGRSAARACWKPRTAASVLGPKMPSTLRPRLGSPERFRNWNSVALRGPLLPGCPS